VFPGDDGPLKGIPKLLEKVVALSGVKFSAQTLRRNIRVDRGRPRDIPYLALKRLLNHKAQDVTGSSSTVDRRRAVREPMQKITDFILSHVGERPSAEVVKLKTAESRA
jgi:hypothetical protein